MSAGIPSAPNLERGAKKLGYKPFPAPMAIYSQVYNGRFRATG